MGAKALAMAHTALLTAFSAVDPSNNAWTLGAGATKMAAVATNDGDTSYIESTALNQLQLFSLDVADSAFTAIPSAAVIASADLGFTAIRVNASNGQVQGVLRDTIVTTPVGIMSPINTTIAYVTTAPSVGNNAMQADGASALTRAYLAAAFWGVQDTRATANRSRVTQIILDVEWTYPAPALSGAPTVNAAGTRVTVTWAIPVSNAAIGSVPTLSASGGPVTLAYTSGNGTASIVYTTSRTIYASETVTLSLAAAQIFDPDSILSNAAINARSVTNGSTHPAAEWRSGRMAGPAMFGRLARCGR